MSNSQPPEHYLSPSKDADEHGNDSDERKIERDL